MRQINLMPEELKNADRIRSAKVRVCAIVCVPLMILAAIHFVLVMRIQKAQSFMQQPDDFYSSPEIKALSQKLLKARKDKQKFIKDHEVPLTLLDKSFPYSNIFKGLGAVAADRVWLTQLMFDSEKKTCVMDGRSFNTRLVSEFMLDLKKMPYFETVNLSSMEKGEDTQAREITFKIMAQLK